MPHYYFRELWTPLSWVGIKLFHDDQGAIWYKIGSHHRKRLRSVK